MVSGTNFIIKKRKRILKKIPPKNIPSESEIRKKFIPDPEPGSRIQGVKKHRIPDPDPQHCFHVFLCSYEL
jgi:hypothetical protein